MIPIKYDKISYILFLMFFLSCTFDPVDYFGTKKILFVLIFFYLIILFLQNKVYLTSNRIFIGLLFITFGLIGFFFHIINFRLSQYDNSQAFSYLLTFSLFIIFVFLNKPSLNESFRKSLVVVGVCIILYTISVSFLFVFFNQKFGEVFYYLNYTLSNSFITNRSFGSFNISMVYLKSVVLLLPIIVVFWDRYKDTSNRFYLIMLTMSIISMCLSGTRTNIILGLFMAFVIVLILIRPNYRKYLYFFCVCLLPFAIYFILDFVLKNADHSSDIKSSLFDFYIKTFVDDISYIFIGDGFGSVFYATSKSKYVSSTELVYFDLFKFFGGIIFLFFIGLLLYPFSIFIRKRYVLMSASYFCYLLVSATNPLLISSTGMIALVYYFNSAQGDVIRIKRELSCSV
ncbi:O-antigen polymerase [Aliivibrio fischeri]|uniref:O-antigen polymerase n=1 Tax=Aliivibrio fischeri TaxID=668 RepID=UPI0007C5571F|nr:O-antigen polymerase [Aliivibrio fischeri]